MSAVRAVRSGAVLAVLYLAVAALTVAIAKPSDVRPVYDGFGSHPQGIYLWLNPPNGAAGNERPHVGTAQILIEGSVSLSNVATTDDGQALATFESGAIPPNPPDRMAEATLVPFDSTTLGALPEGLQAEGNAYRLTAEYRPSGTSVTGLQTKGVIALTAAGTTDVLLHSADGRTWREVAGATAFGPGSRGMTGSFETLGYYLPASSPDVRAAADDGSWVPIAAALLLGVGVGALARDLLPRGLRRIRTTAAPASTPDSSGRGT